MAKVLRPKRALQSKATSTNPVLAKGEIMLTYSDSNYGSTASSSSNKIYLGDGATSFTKLRPFIAVGAAASRDVDTSVTNGSTKLVTSGAVYAAIDASITQALNNSY